MPLLADIAELTRRGGQIAGEGYQRHGDIWAHAIDTIGQIASRVPEQIQQAKAQQQEQAMRELALRQAKQGEADDMAIRAILQQHQGDIDSALPDIIKAAPAKGAALQKQITEARKTGLETHKLQLENADKGLSMGTQILNSVNDQQSYDLARKAIGGLSPEVAAQMPPQYDPAVVDKFKMWGTSVAELNKRKHDALTEYVELAKLDRGTPEYLEKATKVLGQYLSGSATPQEWQQALQTAPILGIPPAVVQMFPPQFSPEAVAQATKLSMPPDERQRLATAAAAQTETARHNAVDERLAAGRLGVEQAKLSQEGEAPSLTPEGIDAVALNFAKTGQLPPMGMGKQATALRTKIINRAAEMNPALDLASNRADFAANEGALKQLQKQRDAIGAFEQTAKKNIDVFLNAAGKVVDTGSPLANSIARTISGKVLGSPDQTAYDAARQVAINEVAKITGNPTLTGQLSDTARKEVEAFNPANATLKQTVEVMRLLRRDMDNRTSSLDEQIAAIKSRIRNKSETSKPDTTSAKPHAGETRSIAQINALAQQYGLTYADAKKRAEDQGYVIK